MIRIINDYSKVRLLARSEPARDIYYLTPLHQSAAFFYFSIEERRAIEIQ